MGVRVGMWRRVGVCVDVAGWTFGSVDGGCVDVDRGCLYILYCICTGVGIFVRGACGRMGPFAGVCV